MTFKATSLTTISLLIPRSLLTLATGFALASAAMAASSLTNSLTGFTGDSTQAGTQAELAAAGFSVFSTAGFSDNGTPGDPGDDSNPAVTFDAEGAHFGSLIAGDAGRNYIRTLDSDFATVSFVAEITFVTTDLDTQDAFIGMGAGDTALFGWPDWSTQFSSVILTPEFNANLEPLLTTMYTTNDTPIFVNQAAPDLASGVNRIRMTYNATAKTVDFAMDYQYAGGEFTQDDAAPTLDVSALFAAPELFGAEDYTVWRNTLGSTEDLTANWDNVDASMGVIDQADYDFWKLTFWGSAVGWLAGRTVADLLRRR